MEKKFHPSQSRNQGRSQSTKGKKYIPLFFLFLSTEKEKAYYILTLIMLCHQWVWLLHTVAFKARITLYSGNPKNIPAFQSTVYHNWTSCTKNRLLMSATLNWRTTWNIRLENSASMKVLNCTNLFKLDIVCYSVYILKRLNAYVWVHNVDNSVLI